VNLDPASLAAPTWPTLAMGLFGVAASILWGRTAYQLNMLANALEKEQKATADRRDAVDEAIRRLELGLQRVADKVGVPMDLT